MRSNEVKRLVGTNAHLREITRFAPSIPLKTPCAGCTPRHMPDHVGHCSPRQ
jgi:hypothetical protein